ncbi:hypothetical protein [Rhizobium lusitanum]|uniref:Uncharacterized protein n=1 Tax=Rhizobium lusitanum TaxID=293958 RepID=A0A7X0MG33_9HYPH|nr:hypothetical protein [Rhizobium lusitanum]MBB6487765.1 hypothetical protein [Rhizobium lusitanum]
MLDTEHGTKVAELPAGTDLLIGKAVSGGRTWRLRCHGDRAIGLTQLSKDPALNIDLALWFYGFERIKTPGHVGKRATLRLFQSNAADVGE